MRCRLEVSWHNATKPCDLTATVNDAVAQTKFMFLSGEICLANDRQETSGALVNKCLGSIARIAYGERIRCKPIALCWVADAVI